MLYVNNTCVKKAETCKRDIYYQKNNPTLKGKRSFSVAKSLQEFGIESTVLKNYEDLEDLERMLQSSSMETSKNLFGWVITGEHLSKNIVCY